MKKNGFFYLFLFSFLAVFVVANTVNADYFAGGRKNAAKPFAYYDSSVASYNYTSYYDAGRSYWNSHSKVNISKTSTFSSANRPDTYFITDYLFPNVYGQAIPYTITGFQASENDYWDYVEIFMYDNNMRATGSKYTAPNVRYNAAHEIGHSIKMAHVTPPYNSVMVQGLYSIPASLTSYDSGQVDSKWPLP